MSTLSDMPWKTHAVLAVVCPVVMVTPAWHAYGFGPTDWPSTQLLMSDGILLFAWAVAAGLIWLEVAAVSGHRLSEARWFAFTAHVWLALVGTLPVWLSFFFILSAGPIDVTSLHQAGINYGLLLVGYLFATAAIAGLRASEEITP